MNTARIIPLGVSALPPSSRRAPASSSMDVPWGSLAPLTRVIDSGARLVTILGPAGVGKSSLASRLATAQATAGASVRTIDARQPLRRQLARVEGGAPRKIIVLDQVDGALARVREFVAVALAASPANVVLCSAREPLHVESEVRHELTGMSTSMGATLFVAAAARIGVDVEDTGAVEAIVEMLEGNPLAIQLAASRTNVLSVSQIAEAVRTDPLDVLRSRSRVGEERHRSFYDAIDASWQTLTMFEREALLQCAAIEEPFTLDEARARLSLSRDGSPVLDVLGRLRDCSLLRLVSAPHEWVARLQVGRLTRAFCRAALAPAGPGLASDAEEKASDAFCVEQNGSWFEHAGRKASLARRKAMKRILLALVRHREARPGKALSAEELIAVGWPSEQLRGQSGVARLRVAINELRNMGLRAILITYGDGYLVSPDVPLLRMNDGAAAFAS